MRRIDKRTVPNVLGGHNRRVGRVEARDPVDILQVQVNGVSQTVIAGNARRVFVIDPSLHLKRLTGCAAFVSTVSSSGNILVMLRNVTGAVDMLSTTITIEAGANTSYAAAAQPVVDIANSEVQTGDLIAIDVDNDGTGARGLGVVVAFSI